MSASSKISRRNMLRLGLGAAAGAVSSSLFAQSNLSATPAQTEGPFYPKHDQDDKDPDLTQIKGHSERAEGQ